QLVIIDPMSLKFLAAFCLLALPAAGAEPPLPKLRVEPTTGGSIFYVRNVSTQPPTAHVIEMVDYPRRVFQLYEDEISSEPIPPDKEKKIQVANMTVGAVPDYVKIQAAVYADGSTAGVKERVNQILSRRQFSLDTVRDLIRRVTLMKDGKSTP